MSVTIKQIAELAGVSCGTVDRAIHGRGRVNPEVCKRILAICESLDYKPSKAGRQLAIQKQHIKLGFICPLPRPMSLWSTVMEGVQAAASELAEYNISVEIRHMPFYLPEIELSLIDELIAAGVDGLVLVPLNEKRIANRLNELIDHGIPIVTINSEVEGCHPLAYVGSNYINAGRTAAGLFHLLLPSDPLKIIVFYGTKHMMSQHLRLEGLNNELEQQNREFELLGPFSITNDPDAAYPTALQILQEYPHANAVFTIGGSVDSVCQALLEQLPQRRLIHIGYDRSPIIENYLKQGGITAVIGQEGYRQGYQSLKTLSEYIVFHRAPESDHIITHNEIFIHQNCI